MKKTIALILFIFTLFISTLSFAAGASVTQTVTVFPGGMVQIKFICTGDDGTGAIPDTAISTANMKTILGSHYLDQVRAYPTAGGTAPDAADVFILDANGEDYLGSADGGTTANKGANLIHATLPKSTGPYSYNMSSYWFFPVTNTLTLKVSNQETASANYTIELTFVK